MICADSLNATAAGVRAFVRSAGTIVVTSGFRGRMQYSVEDTVMTRLISAALVARAALVGLTVGVAACAHPGSGPVLSPTGLPAAFGALHSPERTATLRVDHGRPLLQLPPAPDDGVAWLAGSDFATGTVDVLLRGQDVFQRSFIGVAFGGSAESSYEVVYLRPFNFRAADSTRRAHAVQYAAVPEWPWDRLRRERSGVFEASVAEPGDAPEPSSWVRLRVTVEHDSVRVRVGDDAAPVLVVPRLRPGATGRVGYMVGDRSPGDFRPMVLRPDGAAVVAR